MKRIIVTEEEKKSILNLYHSKKIISEQSRFIARLLGSTADDIMKNFGDDAVRSMDDVFSKIFSNPQNIVSKNGTQFLKSASGSEIPFTQIKTAIEAVAQGKVTANQVANYLPRQLADGTEFRNVMIKSLESRAAKQSTQSITKLPIGKVGEHFKNFAKKMGGWLQITNVKGNMSGWKFHVYADNLDEVAFLYEKLLPIVNKYGAGFKAAGEQMLERLSQNAVQKGKGVTIYLPSEVIANGQQKNFLDEIQSAISGYRKTGQISGDRMVTGNIGYRYELSQPIDPTKGVNSSQYQSLYKANEGGGHNIAGNKDIF
jgi:hypothetical protein